MNEPATEPETVGIFISGKNKRVIDLLKTQNKNVIEFPQVQTESLTGAGNVRDVLANIESFDWLIFTDIFSVEYFFEKLEDLEFDLYELDNFRICACGEAVVDRLRYGQIHADVVPRQRVPEVIVSAISEYIYDEHEFSNSNFLIIKPADEYSEIELLLDSRNIKNTVIEIHKKSFDNGSEIGKFIALLSGGAIDRFVLTAAEDIESLLKLTEKENVLELLAGIEIECTDEITAQTLKENELS